MAFDPGRTRAALGSIPGALEGAEVREPGWLSQSDPYLTWPAHSPHVLEEVSFPEADVEVQGGTAGLPYERPDDSGVEALAWYRTFRSAGRPWGIYLRIDAIAAVCGSMFDGVAASLVDKYRLAITALTIHEQAHFAVDVASSQWELLAGEALWCPHKRERKRRHGYDREEERIANAAMLRGIRKVQGALAFTGREAALRAWTRTQPDGYCYGYRLTPMHKFVAALDRHGCAIAAPVVRPKTSRQVLRFASLVLASMHDAPTAVPVYYVYSRASMRIGEIGAFPAVRIVEETPAFKKQLKNVPEATARAYAVLKKRLYDSGPQYGQRMKRWPQEGRATWSLRLNKGDRLHLRQIAGVEFEAVQIGSHKELGHD